MFIAQIQTTGGLLMIGLTDITEEQTNASLGALIQVLSELDDPIVVASNEVHVQEGPEETPTHLSFRYLGSGTASFEDLKAYAVRMNESLAVNVYMCAAEVREIRGGRLEVDFHSFEEVIGNDMVDPVVGNVH